MLTMLHEKNREENEVWKKLFTIIETVDFMENTPGGLTGLPHNIEICCYAFSLMVWQTFDNQGKIIY